MTPKEPIGSASPFEVVHSDLLLGFGDLVAELGGDADALLRAVGLDALNLSGAGYRQIANVLEHAAATLMCADFGLRLASLQGGTRALGPMSAVMQNSRTLGEGLDYVVQHAQAHSQAAHIRLEPDGEGNVLVVHDVLVGQLLQKSQMLEQFMLLGRLIAAEKTGGRARPRRVHFRHRQLSPPSTYRRYFKCEVRFDQHEDGLLYAQADMTCVLVERDQNVYAAAIAHIEAKYPSVTTPIQAQVRGVLLRLIGVDPCGNERVAAELGLHPRTLHRRLGTAGVSFQDMKDEVRRDLALYYLQYTDFDMLHIAERLGYSEHSVLTRVCVRWFGAAPSQVRAAHVGCGTPSAQ